MPALITKAVVPVSYVEDDGSANGTFDLIVTTDELDRDGEVVAKGAFDPLPEHLSADIDHGMSVATTVGSGVPYLGEDGHVHVKGTFAGTELGQQVRQLVREGHVRTASLAFIREKVETIDGVPTVTKGEMLNFAFTPVPANRGAKITSAKSLAAIEELRAPGRVAVKAIVGSVEALQERMSDALRAAYGGGSYWYGWVRGIVPTGDGAGNVVFEAEASSVLGGSSYRRTTFQQGYADDGALVTLTGDPTEVDLAEVVLPDAEAARAADVDTKTASADKPADEAAPARKAAAAESPGDLEDDLALRAHRIRARQRLHG